MQIIRLDKNNLDDATKQAVRSIKFGGLVIARADTSYAILGLPHSKKAMDELQRLKRGRGSKQYSVFMPTKKALMDAVPDEHKDVVKSLLPGEVTIAISRRKPAMRYIKQKTINSILDKIGEPLTATSANPSDDKPARSLIDMHKYFACNRVLVLYEGDLPEKLPSTIIDFSGPVPKIIRQGKITLN